jgi:hypothetical protein
MHVEENMGLIPLFLSDHWNEIELYKISMLLMFTCTHFTSIDMTNVIIE